jgi:two-component system phosphate regulon sensor histidine kinase PhoR
MKILNKIQHFVSRIWGARPFWLRVLLCWAVGCAFLYTDYYSNYDYRYKLRGNTHQVKDIALLMINETDWRKMKNVQIDTFESLRSLYLNETLTDNYYWDEELWGQILQRILEFNPKKVGMTFFFGTNLGDVSINAENTKIFRNPKIVWPARLSPDGQIQFPLFSRHKDAGVINIYPDMDGMVRSYETSYLDVPHFAYMLSDKKRDIETYRKSYVINYQVEPDGIHTYRLIDLFTGKIKKEDLENKTIIIGTKDSSEHLYPTPMGYMTKAEVVAQIVDNFNSEGFPRKLPIEFYSVYLLILLSIALVLIFQYPQSYSMALITCFCAIAAGFSAWAFDSYYIWVPIFSAIIQMVATYIIFIGYKLAQNERKTWHLEQEKSYLFELEQLKNNFISLISHDLKTPIAKIQGIADRMLQTTSDTKIKQDLDIVKNSSQDLYRYIQSILQITRVESSDFKIRKEATDINELVEKTIVQLMPLAYEKNITITTKLEPMFSIEIDTALVHEVIANLIENAIKYTPNGGSVEVHSEERNNQVQISVKDTGEGIPPEEADQVWEKFYRGKKHNLHIQGTGLGLYLVKYFIELHGGKVFLKSTPQLPLGTEVGFTLPVEAEKGFL